MAQAIQVFECSLVSAEVHARRRKRCASEHRFVLEVEKVQLQPRLAAALEAGRRPEAGGRLRLPTRLRLVVSPRVAVS
ncbi:MAG: hypothetical protein U1F43_13120 [Myxococcota bacterium]